MKVLLRFRSDGESSEGEWKRADVSIKQSFDSIRPVAGADTRMSAALLEIALDHVRTRTNIAISTAISLNYGSRGPRGHVSLWPTRLDPWWEEAEREWRRCGGIDSLTYLDRDVSRGQSQLHDHLRFGDRWFVIVNPLEVFVASHGYISFLLSFFFSFFARAMRVEYLHRWISNSLGTKAEYKWRGYMEMKSND